MERMIRITGTLNPCKKCKKQPGIFENFANGHVHFECQQCRVRLWPFPSLQEAMQDWEDCNPKPSQEEPIPAAA